jgi:hypothetical protein
MNKNKQIHNISEYSTDSLEVQKQFETSLLKHHIIFDENFYFDNHLLWYGSQECNKKNIVRYFIFRYYKDKNIKLHKHVFQISNNHDTLNIIIYKSNYHWEIDFNWTGNNTNNYTNKNSNDQYVIDYFINNFCKTTNINVDAIKILVFFNTNRLTYNNQKMILRIMENRFNNVKFIIVTDQYNRIDSTIRSRCINVRIPMIFDEYYYHIKLDETSNEFMFTRFKVNNYSVCEKPLENLFDYNIQHILKKEKWTGNSEKEYLNDIFHKIMKLKHTYNSNTVNIQYQYNDIIENIDNYLLSCHTIQEFFKAFINFISTYDDEIIKSNITKYIEFFATMEFVSQKCDYQIYILESTLSFFLLN